MAPMALLRALSLLRIIETKSPIPVNRPVRFRSVGKFTKRTGAVEGPAAHMP